MGSSTTEDSSQSADTRWGWCPNLKQHSRSEHSNRSVVAPWSLRHLGSRDPGRSVGAPWALCGGGHSANSNRWENSSFGWFGVGLGGVCGGLDLGLCGGVVGLCVCGGAG